MSVWEVVQTYEFKKEQMNSFVWVLKFFAKRAFLQTFLLFEVENTWISWIFWSHCSLCFRCQREILKKLSRCEDSWTIWTSWNWKNVKTCEKFIFTFKTRYLDWNIRSWKSKEFQEVGSKDASESWFRIWVLIIFWYFSAFQKVL